MKLKQLKLNPDNPQKFDDLTKLENSIKEFPKMMEYRPMVYDPETMYVIGGNKRLLCLQNLGFKDIPDNWAVSASGLSKDEIRRFIIADNVGFGEWDWVKLSDWDAELLSDWGLDEFDIMDVGEDEFETPNVDIEGETEGLNEYVIISFDNKGEYKQFKETAGIAELRRVITFEALKKLLK